MEKDKITPPLRYPGSKYRAYKYIEQFILLTDHDEYREPFCGSSAVFFQKNTSKISWLNDKDSGLMNFYKIIQNRYFAQKLADESSKVEPSKDYFNCLKNTIFDNDYERALQYFIINRTAYSGIMNLPNWGFHKIKSVQPKKWPERILKASDKLQNVILTSLDYEQVIFAPAQGEKVLLFVDPPYYMADQKRAYIESFKEEDHIRLVRNLKNVKFNFILTYDDCEEVRNLYKWANIHPVEFMYHTANSNVTTRKMGKELIITNF